MALLAVELDDIKDMLKESSLKRRALLNLVNNLKPKEKRRKKIKKKLTV